MHPVELKKELGLAKSREARTVFTVSRLNAEMEKRDMNIYDTFVGFAFSGSQLKKNKRLSASFVFNYFGAPILPVEVTGYFIYHISARLRKKGYDLVAINDSGGVKGIYTSGYKIIKTNRKGRANGD